MSDFNQTQDPFAPVGAKPVVPKGLNVLTILTFIGCGVGLIFAFLAFAFAQTGYEQMEKAMNSGDFENLPSFIRDQYTPEKLEQARIAAANRLPILIINLASIGLCLFGAIQMRKLKMSGYYSYVVGELLPFVGTIVFIGVGAITGFWGIFSVCVALLFIILYTGQRKNLINQ